MSDSAAVQLVYHGPLQRGERWPGEYGDVCVAAQLERVRMFGRARAERRHVGDMAGLHPTFEDCLRSFGETGASTSRVQYVCPVCGAVERFDERGRGLLRCDPVKHRAAGAQPRTAFADLEAEDFLPARRAGDR